MKRVFWAVRTVVLAIAFCVTATSLRAQTTYSWTGSQDGNWSTSNAGPLTNWAGDVVPPSDINLTIISFDANSTANLTTTNDLGAFSMLGLVVANPSGAVSIAGGTLTVGANGIDMSSATQNLTVSAGIVTSGVQNWNVAGGQTLTASGSLTIGSALTVNGGGTVVMSGPVALTSSLTLNNASGTLTLSGSNTGTGGVNLTAGTLNVNSATALGTGTLTIAGGTINNSSAGAVTLTTNNPMAWNGNFAFAGTQALNLGTGAVTLNAARTITVNGTGALTVGGGITGATFGITKAGTGTLTLNGVVGTTTGTVTVNAGALILTGTNTYTGLTTIANGATLQLGNATAGNVVIASGSAITNNGNLIFAPGTGTNPTYANVITQSATGTLTLNGATASNPSGLTLSATTNNIGGQIIINQGRLIFNALTNLGNAATPIIVNGNATNGGQLWANAAITVANPLTLNGYGALEGAGNLGAIRGAGATYSGTVLLQSNASIDPENTTTTLSGVISGPGQLLVGVPGNRNPGGTVAITSANNPFTGGVFANGSTAAANAVAAFGPGAIIVGSTTITSTNSGLTQSVGNGIFASNSITLNSGTVTLSQVNNFFGGVTIVGGTFNNNAAGALGSNLVTQTGGTFAQSAVVNGGVGFILSGGTTNLSQVNTYSGGAAISGTNTTNVTVAGGLNGLTTMTGGTLSTTVLANPANNGLLSISGGLLTSSAATGGQYQNVSLGGTGVINPNGQSLVGVNPLVVNNFATAGGTLQFDTTGPTSGGAYTGVSDLLSLIGSYSIGTGTAIGFTNSWNPTAAGNYRLIQYSGSAPTLANFTLPTAPGGLTYSLSTAVDPGFVNFVVAGTYAGITANWIPTAAGPSSWNTAANWTGGVVPKLAGDTANFNSVLTANQIVTVDAQQQIGTLNLNPGAAFTYTINTGATGSAIVMNNNATAAAINNLAQNNTVAAPIALFGSNTNVTAANGTTLTLSGVISGPGKLTIAGAGTGIVSITGANTFTGGIEIAGGTLRMSAVGGFGAATNLITMNGGTLSLNGTTTQITFATTQVVNFASASTIDIPTATGTLTSGANPATAKYLTSAPNQLQGTGTITKTGNGGFQLVAGAPNPTLTSNWVLNGGIVEAQNPYSLGSGTVTINSNAGLVSSGVILQNAITLNGGTLSANNNNNGIFTSTVNIGAGGGILSAAAFQNTPTATAFNFAVGGLSGSGPVSIIGPASGTAAGIVTLGSNTSGYTGTITVGLNGILGLGSSQTFGNANLIVFNNASAGLALVADGDATGNPETLSYTLSANLDPTIIGAGTGNPMYYVGRIGATALSNTAVNKTISVTNALPFNAANTLNVTPLHGFGLLLGNQPALAATATFNVAGAQASNIVQGLTLQNLTGAFGIVKSGTGTLVLDTGNTFGGAGALIDITGGYVAAATDSALGNSANAIRLNVNSGTQGFRATGSFSTGRTFTLNAAANTIDVIGGNTLTITSGLAYAAVANALQKNNNGTLILSAAATGAPTSGTTITAGVLQISNSNQIGSGTITNATAGAALQLGGGATFTQAIALNSAGISGSVGGLTSLSGANTISGTITINGGSLITNQDSGNNFTLGAIANANTGFNVGGAGVVVLGGAITGTGVVNAVGTSQVRVTSNGNTTTGAMGAYGTGANLVFTGASGSMSAGTLNSQYGGLVTLDNTVNNLNNRTSTGGAGAAFHSFVTVGSGSLLLTGNATNATSETLLGINVGRGQTTFTVTPNAAQPANLVLTATGGAWTRQAFATAVFASGGGATLATNNITAGAASINTGAITTAGNFRGAGTTAGFANYGVLPWALVNNNGTISLATSTVIGASGFIRTLEAGETTGAFVNNFDFSPTSTLVGSFATTSNTINTANTSGLFLGQAVSGTGIAAGSFITAIDPGVSITLSANTTAVGTNVPLIYSTANTNIGLTTASTGPVLTLAQTINSLTLGTGSSLTLNNSIQTLTIGGNALGGAIVSLDNAATISGGILTTGGNFELIFQTPSDLTVSSTIIGGGGGANNGITKGGAGTLNLTGVSFHTGQTILNAGTLNLNGGNNTIRFANYLTVADGATLNLNGNVQVVTDLFSDSAVLSGLGTVGANSTITGTAGATLVIKSDGGARNYTGVMAGGMGLVQSGPARTWVLTQNQTYTGPTLINSGTITLQNSGALSGTSALTIARANLNLDNTGSIDLPTRLPTSLGITLQGGQLTLVGRTQFTSATTVGAITASEGANTISVTQPTTGIALAALTLTGLTRSAGATVNFTNSGGTLGAIGTNPRILYASAPTLTNGILGGGFTVNGNDFAGYIPTLGVGALGTAGFAGYSPLPLNNAAATDNVTMPTSTGAPLNTMTINSLRVTGTPTIVFNAGQTLTIASGGLIASGSFTMGSVVNQGILTSGGSELFLLGSATSTINSAITGTGVALVKSGSGTYTLAGTNTYTGGTYIDQGTLTVAATGQLGTGGIFHNGGTLTVNAGGVIPAQAISVTGNGVLNLNSNLGITGSSTFNSNTLTLANVLGVQVGQLVSGTGLPGGLTVASVNPLTNTVTLSGNLGVTAQTGVAYTFLVNNSATTLNFNNNGGTAAPAVNVTGILNLTTGTITASSNNVGTTAILNGGSVDFANVASPTITVNPIQFNGQNLAPYQPTLSITSAIKNSNNPISVTGGGNLQLSGASTYSGGVNLAAGTSLTIAGGSTNSVNGVVLSGPLGTGTFTIGSGSTLFHDGNSRTVANNVVVGGSFTFDAPSTAVAILTLGQNNSTIALPASAATTITVNAPNMIGAFGGTVTGSVSSIVKAGQGTLQLNNILGGSSTFSGGVTLNAGTLSTSGVGATLTALGSGAVTINGGILALRHSGLGLNSLIAVGNAVAVNSSLADAFIDINNNGGNTGNAYLMGALNYSGFIAGSAAPATVLNVTGGNGYKIIFNGSNLSGDGITSGANTRPVYNVASGLTAVINAGTAATGFTASNLPKNIGAGTLLVAGNYTGTAPASITGTQAAYVLTNAATTPLGTGGITLNAGATLQLNPIFNTLSNTGYTSGGTTAKYYNTGAATMASAANFGVAPGSVLQGVLPNDGVFRQGPVGVNNGGMVNTLVVYQGLLNVTTPGTYYIGGGTDDQMQVTINGQLVQNDIGGGHALDQRPLLPITLQAGANSVVIRAFNVGGGGSVNFFFGGADTSGYGSTGLAVVNNMQAVPLTSLSYSTVYNAANGYQNAALLNNAITVAATGTSVIDGLGTDFNYGIPSLTLGNASTLTVANGTGASGFMGNGAFIVTGTADVSAGGGIINPTTGTLVLSGGITDGGQGLTKTGAGNLILGASTLFTGALNINGGFVQLADPAALTTGVTTIGVAATTPATLDLNGQNVTTTGGIVLNGGFGPASRSSNAGAGLYNSSGATATLPVGMNVTLGAAISSVNPQIGGFGDIVINGVIQDGAGTAFNKLTPNTLTLNGLNTFSGALTISAGRVVLGNASALGTIAGNTTVVGGATLDLNGFGIAENLTINGTGITVLGVPNTLGAVVNNTGSSVSLSGAFALATASAVGSSSYSATAGGITISGPVSGAFGMTKLGKSSLTITSAAAATTFFDIQVGGLTFSGNGSQFSTNNANLLRQGATLTLDNAGTPVSNRMGNHGLWFSGSLVINGNNGTAVSEVVSQGGNNFALGTTFGNGFGAATMTLNTVGTSGVTVQVASTSTSIFARATGSTLLLRGDNLGGTPGAGTATVIGSATSLGYSVNGGQATGQAGTFGNANTLIYPWAVVDTSAAGVGSSFATYRDNTQGIVPLSSVTNAFVTAAPSLITTNANTTNANASVTVANATGLAIGMVVQGTGIAANTTITAIAGNVLTLSANAAATANNTLTFSTGNTGGVAAPNLISTASTNAVGLGTAGQILNSITLNNPGTGAALTITGGLQLDSGGILAVGTDAAPTAYAISGAMLGAANGFARELIIHTTGAQTTLTVSAPIFTSSGLTKADGGTLILGSTGMYTGDTSITGGMLQLAGGTNTIFKVFTTAPTSGNSNNLSNGGTFSGANFTVSFGGTLDLNGNNQAVANLRSGSAVPLAGGTIINGTGTATFHTTLTGNQTWAGNVSNAGAGVLNFVRDGNNTLTVNSPNTFGGSFTTSGGATTLVDLGTFENAASITVRRAALIWDDRGVQAVSNRISATAPINLNGGGLQFLGRAGSNSTLTNTITLGTLNIGTGASTINLQVPNQGGSLAVQFAGIGTRATGGTLNFGNAAYAIGDNPRVTFSAAPTLTNGIIGGWATAFGLVSSTGGTNASFATYDPASGIRVLQYQPNATYGAGVNTMLTGNATLPAPANTATTTTVNTLTMYNATTLSFTNWNDTLVVQSGGILAGTDANGRAIGTTAVQGRIVSGAGNDLFLNVANSSLTVNAKILDNGSNNNLVISGLGIGNAPSVTLTNANTYGGTTFVSGVNLTLNSLLGVALPGDLVISGSTANAGDSNPTGNTIVNFNQSNQLAATSNVTINGGAQINLGNGSNGLASNTQTINNLTFNNDGGTNSNVPNVLTGAGGLTINGTLSSTNITEVASIPAISGFLALTTGNIVVDANLFVPNQIGLAINANITATSITKTGSGYLGLGGQSANFTGTFNLNAGGLAVSSTSGATVGALLGGQVVMAANTTVDPRGLTGVFGSIVSTASSASIVNGLQGTAGTVVTGLDNASGTFAGTISSPYPTGLLNVTKIGTGTWTLTNDSSATNNGTLTVSGGSILLASATAKQSFTTTAVQTGATITLDNSANALSNRLGSPFLTTTAATLFQTARTVNLAGGNLTVSGNASTVVNEGLGNVTGINGSTITLAATGTAGVNLTLQSISNLGTGTSLLIRGDGIGSTAGADIATVRFANAAATVATPGMVFPGTQGAGANNAFTKSIRPDILVDTTSTGLGAGFLTIDSVTGLVRPLGFGAGITTASELSPTLTTGTTNTTNVGLSSVAFGSATGNTLAAGNFSQNVVANSLTLQSGGGVNLAIVAGNPWGANGGLLTFTNNVTAGVLNVSGNNSLNFGTMAYGSTPSVFHVLGTSTLAMNGTFSGSSGGLIKAGDGTLVLNQPYLGNNAQQVTINGGTLRLAAGTNTLWVYNNGTGAPSAENLAVNKGGLDLNGNNQLVGTLTTTNPLPFAGGTVGSPNSVITNSSATLATFTTNAANTTIGTVFSGNLNFDKAGSGAMALSSPQTYTGSTVVRGGSLTLRDLATLNGTTSVTANYGNIIVDNTTFADIANRIPTSTPVTLSGGAFRFSASPQVQTNTFGTFSLNGGMNELMVNGLSTNAQGSQYTIAFNNLVQAAGATMYINSPNNTVGNIAAATTRVYLSQLNGTPFSAASLVNGIVAPWMVVSPSTNNVEWASYTNVNGVIPLGNFGSAYSGNALGASVITDNISVAATVQSVTARTINTLAVRNPGAVTTIGLNGPLDQLTIATGGILLNNNGQTVTFQGGSLTAGAGGGSPTLYLNAFNGTTVFNTPIVNNSGVPLSVVRSGSGTVTLSPLAVQTVASVPVTSTTITVPNSTGLVIGMRVTGTNVTAGSTITAISGNTITLSAATGATAAPNAQVSFSPVQSTATASTTAGSTTVTVAAGTLPTGFTPAAGMIIGSSVNILGGTTVTAVSGTGPWTLTLSQPATTTTATATVVFNPLSNTYTGTTIVSNGSLNVTGGSMILSGLPGSIAIPGNLTINNSIVTMNTNQGQIASTSNVTVNGGGVLTLVGTNTLNSVTFNNNGGTTTPNVAVGTALNLSSATPITATTDNTGTVPTISGTGLNLTNAGGATINVAGASANGLVLNVTNLNSTGTITKTGTGSLILQTAQTAALTWALNGGSILVNNNTAMGTSTAAGALTFNGDVGMSVPAVTSVTISLPTRFTGPTTLTLGNQWTGQSITLGGTMDLNNQNPTISVPVLSTTQTISGQIIGGGGFTKAGNGALTLSGSTSTFTGPVVVNGGMLTLGNANALGGVANAGTDMTVATTAAFNLNNVSLSIGSLAGGGIVTNSGAGVQTLTIGAGLNATNANFAGSLVAATPANLAVTKAGTNIQTLSGQSYYTGATAVNGGTLLLRNGSTAATTPTLANTTVTVAGGATLAVSSAGAAPATSNTVNIGNATTTNAGASLTLSNGASFDMRDTTIGAFNVLGNGTGTSFTTSSASTNLYFDIGSTGADLLALSRAASATGGTINLNVLTGTTSLPTGVITLINAAGGGFAGTGTNNFTLASPSLTVGPRTYNLTLAGPQTTATQTALLITVATPSNAYWAGAVDANWNTGALSGVTNWRTDATSDFDTQALPGAVTNVFFNTTTPVAANLSNTLNAAFVINSLNVTAAAAAGVTISDATNALTIDATSANGNTAGNGISIANGAGPVIINSAVVLGGNQTWTNGSTTALVVNGNVSGGANLTTVGNVTLTASNNSYSGTTTVSSGELRVNGSITGTGAVSVAGTLSGNGTVAGPVTVNTGGTIRGGFGSGTGTLTTGNATVASGGSILTNLGASGVNSQLALGTATIDLATTGTTLKLVGITGFDNTQNGSWIIASTTAGTITLGGAPTNPGDIFGTYVQGPGATGNVTIDVSAIGVTLNTGDQFQLSRNTNNVILNFTAAVPEPALALGLAAAGLGLAGWVRRRRVSNSNGN